MSGWLAQLAIGAMLLAAFWLLAARRWPVLVALYQLQSAALAVAAAAQGRFVAALLVAGLAAWALPLAMRQWQKPAAPAMPPAILLSLGAGLAAAAMLAAPAGLAVPLSLLLLGLLALCAKAPPAMALAMAANGVLLAAFGAPR